jgi:predicted nucleic acid-binding protein
MTHGIDTDFLVAVEVLDHPHHADAWALFQSLLQAGERFAVAPQVLAEFAHVVTDPRRMPNPLSMDEALARAERWWNAGEVFRVFPTHDSTRDFLLWMRLHRLGRKRLLDTMLAAAYFHAGVRRLITNNQADYRSLGCFDLVGYAAVTPNQAGKDKP